MNMNDPYFWHLLKSNAVKHMFMIIYTPQKNQQHFINPVTVSLDIIFSLIGI